MEQAATVRKGALTVMGLIEETITTEGWIQTNHIQEDETMTERERVISVLEYFKNKNDKYNQKRVEAEEAKLNTMGTCKTRTESRSSSERLRQYTRSILDKRIEPENHTIH